MCRSTSGAHTAITDNVTHQRGRTVNLNNPANTYDLAVQHGHDLTDAAERRRQTHRFQRWMSSRRQFGAAISSGR
jgi:hypothetical protein